MHSEINKTSWIGHYHFILYQVKDNVVDKIVKSTPLNSDN